MSDLTELRKALDHKTIEHRASQQLVLNALDELALAEQHVLDAMQAQSVIQNVAQQVQQKAHAAIAQIVSKCLAAVFGEDAYAFEIVFERKRGRTEAVLQFVRDGKSYNPTSECGGGVVDIAAFALRLACLMLERPHRRRLLVLDEPFRFVSPQYQHLIPGMLMTLAKDLDLQIVMTTNIHAIITGKVVELEGV
jgi:ABC-type Mn2+/Zn2+ transport system ATPase subunit